MGEKGNGNAQTASFIHVDFTAPGDSRFNLAIQGVSREQILFAVEWVRVMVDNQIRQEMAAQAQQQPRIAVPGLVVPR